ncbi:MAG: RNA polymerase sigma factor, partial [Bacteroidales bacterium]|nr:RNA polymerase sigma factor [Bacteroidales bacterium]
LQTLCTYIFTRLHFYWNNIPLTYLGKLTRRISIDMFRKKNRKKRWASEYAISLSELEECISVGDVAVAAVDAQLLGEVINAFLKKLPKESRNAFIGRYYFLDSVKEVARYLGISESKAKSILFRTRGELKTYLEKEGFEV